MYWEKYLSSEAKKPYFKEIMHKVQIDKAQGQIIYPPQEKIFSAFANTPLESIKVVILGQDPYHGPNEAHGMAFSVNKEIKIPPSLRNIFKELHNDLGIPPANHGDLSSWAMQGVLLLNTSLTVRHKIPGSHSQIGWQTFTDQVIKCVSTHQPFVVFLLWGAHAQKKIPLIDTKHLILTSAHPSPLSAHRGFLGSRHFSMTNDALKEKKLLPIDWTIK